MPRPRDTLFQFGGLADFLHFLDWACGLANTPERLARMAYDFCKRLQEDGTGYADVIVNPTHWSCLARPDEGDDRGARSGFHLGRAGRAAASWALRQPIAHPDCG